MRKATLPLIALALLAVSQVASAVNLRLLAHNQRSSSGTLSTLKWDGCATFSTTTPCINPGNATLAAMGITPSTAVWQWDPVTGVLSMTGSFNTASTLGSSGAAAASVVIGDRVANMTIDTTNQTTTATTYNCAEGNFLAGVGAHGCANVSTGADFVYDGSVAYNVGGNANCVQRTLGGDDVSTGNPRGLVSAAATGPCDAVDGAFNLFTVVTDNTGTLGGQLRISNGVDIALPGTNYLTFEAVQTAEDDGPFPVLEATPEPIDVLANDLLFADPVTVTVTTAPTKGTATVIGSPGNQAGITIEYTATAGQSGADSFVYTVTDATGSDTATVTLNILAGGANDDTASTTRNAATFNINVGGNDVGFSDPVTITLVSGPDAGGTATPPAAGPPATRAFSYTPATVAPGTPSYVETFTYEITDGVITDTAIVTVNVNNTVPVANDVPLNFSTAGVDPADVEGTFNAATFAGNSLGNTPSTVSLDTTGTLGTVSLNSGTNVITYTLPAGAFTVTNDTFSYTITDSDPDTAETDTGTVTVNVPDVAPSLADASITTTAGTTSAPRNLTLILGNGSAAQHSFAVSTQATNGSCALNGTNTAVTYTPNAGYSGPDSCVVTVTDEDGAGDSDTGTFSITVNAAAGGGSTGGGGGLLPGGGGSLDGWSLSLLAGLAWLRSRRRAGHGISR